MQIKKEKDTIKIIEAETRNSEDRKIKENILDNALNRGARTNFLRTELPIGLRKPKEQKDKTKRKGP